MKRRMCMCALVVTLGVMCGPAVWAQGGAAAPAPPAGAPQIQPPPPTPAPAPSAPAPQSGAAAGQTAPIQVQVVIARFQGEKRVSSLPYTVSLRAPGAGSVRMNSEVPVSSGGADGPFTYRSVGTNIDINAQPLGEGRFSLTISMEDSSVYTDEVDAKVQANARPVFRGFRANNTVFVRNGETSQFATATDRVSGDVIRAEVTLRVLK